jgi:26S proteasome regulatory subunit T5
MLKPKAEDGLDDKDDNEGGTTDVDAQCKTRSTVICT